jgi:hypothetical protein
MTSTYELPPEWTFTATITTPDSVRVETTITIPASEAWPDVLESSELAQMSAVRGASLVRKARESVSQRATETHAEEPF